MAISIYLFLPFQCSFVVNLPMFGFELVLEATALPTELQPMPNFFWDRLLFVSKASSDPAGSATLNITNLILFEGQYPTT